MPADEGREAMRLHKLHPQLSMLTVINVVRGEADLTEELERVRRRALEDLVARTADVEWPRPPIRWDLRRAHWFRSMDGYNGPAQFFEDYPDVRLAWAATAEVHAAIGGARWRKEGPGAAPYRSRTVRLIVHLQEGGKVSPPHLEPTGNKAIVLGGNHRIGWALHVGASRLPVIVSRGNLADAKALMPSLRGPGRV